mmetsp:Transcript_98834/g.185678  ORF Transcript_98834/g.185678 Transcript_98834/m.185678 type:complete len:129 (+) Transcript_98834:90-476(+)
MGMKDEFMKGGWKEGLFEMKCPDCLFQACCGACALAQIHEKLGNPNCSKMVACLLACFCGIARPVMLWQYGAQTLKNKGKDPPNVVVEIAKIWCCGGCYLHQMYKENDCEKDCMTMCQNFKPSQQEMK